MKTAIVALLLALSTSLAFADAAPRNVCVADELILLRVCSDAHGCAVSQDVEVNRQCLRTNCPEQVAALADDAGCTECLADVGATTNNTDEIFAACARL